MFWFLVAWLKISYLEGGSNCLFNFPAMGRSGAVSDGTERWVVESMVPCPYHHPFFPLVTRHILGDDDSPTGPAVAPGLGG